MWGSLWAPPPRTVSHGIAQHATKQGNEYPLVTWRLGISCVRSNNSYTHEPQGLIRCKELRPGLKTAGVTFLVPDP